MELRLPLLLGLLGLLGASCAVEPLPPPGGVAEAGGLRLVAAPWTADSGDGHLLFLDLQVLPGERTLWFDELEVEPFDDLDGDGFLDPGEEAAGWEVNVDAGGPRKAWRVHHLRWPEEFRKPGLRVRAETTAGVVETTLLLPSSDPARG